MQFQTHRPKSSSSIRLCHTSCDILDVGTLESHLTTVRTWLDAHPYEVITIILGNENNSAGRIPAKDYIPPFQRSGILKYIYTPPTSSLNIAEWPTLASMILANTRVVTLLDYGADQILVPWLLDEFASV